MLPLEEQKKGALHGSTHNLGADGQGPAADPLGTSSGNVAIPGMTVGAKIYSAFVILAAGFLLLLLTLPLFHLFGATIEGNQYFIMAVIWIMFVSLSATTALNLYYRRLLRIPTIIQSAALCLVVLGLLLPILGSRAKYNYDKERYSQIVRAIDADPEHLLGKSLEEITRELSLEGVPYDQGDEPQWGFLETPETRIYHFRGFACYVTLSLLPPYVTPDGMYLASSSHPGSPRQGKLPLTVRPPGVVIDGLNSPKERMEQHWKREREAIEQMGRNAERQDKKANKP